MKCHNNTTSDEIPCTSKPCEWNKPRKRKLSPKRIDVVRPVKHQYGKEPRLAAVPSDEKYKACATLPDSALSNLLDGLRIVNPRCALFTALKKGQTVFSDQEISSDNNVAAFEEVSSCNCTDSASSAASINTGTDICEIDTSDQDSNFFHVGCISPYAALPPSVEDIKEKAKGIKRKLHFNKNEIEIVEKRTRLQSKNCDWFLYRKGRITASKCKRVASLKPTTSPSKTLKELLMVNKVPQTYAML